MRENYEKCTKSKTFYLLKHPTVLYSSDKKEREKITVSRASKKI